MCETADGSCEYQDEFEILCLCSCEVLPWSCFLRISRPSQPQCSMLELAFSLQPVLLFRAVCASSRKIEFIRTLGNLFSTRPSSRSAPFGRKDVASHFSDGFLGPFLSHARLLSDGHYLRPTTRITVTPWSAVTAVIHWRLFMSGTINLSSP